MQEEITNIRQKTKTKHNNQEEIIQEEIMNISAQKNSATICILCT